MQTANHLLTADSGSCDHPIDPTNFRTSTLSGALVRSERQHFNTTQEHQVCKVVVHYYNYYIITIDFVIVLRIWLCYIIGGDPPIHLRRTPANQCDNVQLRCNQCEPFKSVQMIARENTTFMAEIGPAANPRGYTAITGYFSRS